MKPRLRQQAVALMSLDPMITAQPRTMTLVYANSSMCLTRDA